MTGEVNDEEVALKECFFEYGETEAYGHKAECEPDAAAVPLDDSFHPVHAKISPEPDTAYHFRLIAVNVNGKSAEGSDQSIATPTVEADAVHEVNDEGKIITRGVINPPAPLGTNEVQEVAISGHPTGGTFTLSYEGEETEPIPFNAEGRRTLRPAPKPDQNCPARRLQYKRS